VLVACGSRRGISSTLAVAALAVTVALQGCTPAPTGPPTPPPASPPARPEATPTPTWAALAPRANATGLRVVETAVPTPAPPPVVPTPAPTSPPPGRLSTSLEQLLDGRDGSQNVGVLVEDQATTERFSHEARRVFRSASVYKLPLACEVLRLVDQQQLALDDVVTIEPEDATEGEPLGGLYVGDEVTIERALAAMISLSSNAAAHALMRVIGRPRLNQDWAAMGWRDTRVPETDPGADDSPPDQAAVTSAADMTDLLDRFLRGQLLSDDSNQLLLRLLSGPARLDPLTAALPAGTEHFEKTGNVDDASTIASVIYTPSGPLILVVLDEDTTPTNARALIGDIAATAYAAIADGQ
jgi:beta-lactamase class A